MIGIIKTRNIYTTIAKHYWNPSCDSISFRSFSTEDHKFWWNAANFVFITDSYITRFPVSHQDGTAF